MFQLVYISKAKKRHTELELAKMMNKFRQRNVANGITGLLLYDGRGTFIQLLEGKKEEVRALFEVISKDPRHERINKLHEQAVPERVFAHWKMGFKCLNSKKMRNEDGFSEFLTQDDKYAFLQSHPEFSVQLLCYFKTC
ncbi:BLUF domain-containing protein [Pseudoalteromonas luteoviolacea]|uniref:BLUF domain-containing protein n=1 Tax=Pseudoalteromonas luteoviolacea TaxID=43657 RepID=UPI001B3589C8|nr:BLUF domain-containing protein [Pseudoalteromonas luteoviolacea]MBQ4813929.1 BLUF domain-containing protein [Pseudoalteromonas luteoviolacea]